MYKTAIALACMGSLALSACNMTNDEKLAVGGLTGVAAGFLTANALNANKEWTIISVLAGAVAGTMVAKNYATQQCAYAKGDGTYYVADCP